jgi:hypothetical protein
VTDTKPDFDRIFLQIAPVPDGYPSDHPFLIRKWSNEPFGGGVAYFAAIPERDKEDAKLFRAFEENYWDLRCISVPSGGGDADVGWEVIEHHCGTDPELVVGRSFDDDPRHAVHEAIARQVDEREDAEETSAPACGAPRPLAEDPDLARLIRAASAVLESWDRGRGGEIEHQKTLVGTDHKYWDPVSSMVGSPQIAALRAALTSALPVARSIPGWKLVPIEPTEDMRRAAVGMFPVPAYRAMVEHAPSVPPLTKPTVFVKKLCDSHRDLFARLVHKSGVTALHANEVFYIANVILEAAIFIDKHSRQQPGREPTELEKDRASDAVKTVLERHGYDIPTVADLCGIAAIRTILNCSGEDDDAL